MPTRWKGGENIVEAAVAKLKTGWQTRATQKNTDWADDILVAAPDTALFFTGRVHELPACPACFVMEGPTTYTREGSHAILSGLDVLVYVFDEDFDGPRLAKRLQRQAACVIETLFDDTPREQLVSVGPFAGEAANSIYRVTPLRTVPGTVFAPQAQESWRSFYIVVFRAEQDEGPY